MQGGTRVSLYAIGDLHLALGCPEKNMDVFGGRWVGYTEKIRAAFSELREEDTVVLCGDTSWGMSLEATLPDFLFLQELPGRKVLLKGNHDYWWETANKMNAFLEKNGLTKLAFLHNNFIPYEDSAICGTRGWFYEEERGGEHDEKIMKREIGRLETSLIAAGEREKLVFLHYPPIYQNYRCEEILLLLEKYDVRECLSGHIHGKGSYAAFRGTEGNCHHTLVSADFLDFIPRKIK